MLIRPEEEGDREAVYAVNASAFETEAEPSRGCVARKDPPLRFPGRRRCGKSSWTYHVLSGNSVGRPGFKDDRACSDVGIAGTAAKGSRFRVAARGSGGVRCEGFCRRCCAWTP